MTQDEIDRVIFGRWGNDTTGYYSMTALDACCE
jgi:hypothetical protein